MISKSYSPGRLLPSVSGANEHRLVVRTFLDPGRSSFRHVSQVFETESHEHLNFSAHNVPWVLHATLVLVAEVTWSRIDIRRFGGRNVDLHLVALAKRLGGIQLQGLQTCGG